MFEILKASTSGPVDVHGLAQRFGPSAYTVTKSLAQPGLVERWGSAEVKDTTGRWWKSPRYRLTPRGAAELVRRGVPAAVKDSPISPGPPVQTTDGGDERALCQRLADVEGRVAQLRQERDSAYALLADLKRKYRELERRPTPAPPQTAGQKVSAALPRMSEVERVVGALTAPDARKVPKSLPKDEGRAIREELAALDSASGGQKQAAGP